ncbi:MAG: ATP-binding cassette domain-containing protein [Acidimicrobiales bacterium]
MSDDLARLRRWLSRARPARGDLARALLTGVLASAVAVGLTTGAVGLLVASAQRPGLRAVAVILVVIELFAFTRSPLRLAERLAAHRLGYAAVTRWRRWLVRTVGQLEHRRLGAVATGDLLERALVDTDRLQDLWLRGAVPLATAGITLVALDITVALLPPLGAWAGAALGLACVEALAVVGLATIHRAALRREALRRRAAGAARAALVELAAAGPALAALGRDEVVRTHLERALLPLDRAEADRRAPLVARYGLLGVAGAIALAVVALHPAGAALWWVVAVTLATASIELLGAIDAALAGTTEVVASAERLESLDRPRRPGRLAVPARLDLEARDLDYHEAGRAVLTGASLRLAPGARLALVGPSGVGKSSLLRLLARLDHPDAGTILLGGVDLADLDEDDLRRRVAYVPSEPGLVTGYARDVVALGRPVAEVGLRLLDELGLRLSGTERVEGLSRGETARVALARALAGRPDLLILDEPTAGLDPGATARVLGALERSGAGVVVATHDPTVARWCEAVVELREGRLAPLSR